MHSAPDLAEARHLVISGRVQGVGFRFAMTREAMRLGLAGWVRNCRNGTVEALIAGPAEAVAGMLAWARRGPPPARVEQVAVALAPAGEVAALPADGGFVQRDDHG